MSKKKVLVEKEKEVNQIVVNEVEAGNSNSISKVKKVPGRPFKQGESGNPSGRPKQDKTLKALAREHTSEAVQCLINIMRDSSASATAQVAAAQAILDRGHGKPLQQLEVGEAGAFSDLPEHELEIFIKDAANKLKAIEKGDHFN